METMAEKPKKGPIGDLTEIQKDFEIFIEKSKDAESYFKAEKRAKEKFDKKLKQLKSYQKVWINFFQSSSKLFLILFLSLANLFLPSQGGRKMHFCCCERNSAGVVTGLNLFNLNDKRSRCKKRMHPSLTSKAVHLYVPRDKDTTCKEQCLKEVL